MAQADGHGLGPLPSVAAWRHVDAREGFEVARFTPLADGIRIVGSTSAAEDGEAWWVRYEIELDASWATRQARIDGGSGSGEHHRLLTADGHGRWMVDGEHDAALDGCLDVDLESSACTNTAPVHRMALAPGRSADAPAAYVRADDLTVERLEQRYQRRMGDPTAAGPGVRLDYSAPRFDYAAVLTFDPSGLVLEYPGLARRVR